MLKSAKEFAIEWDVNEKERFKELIKDVKERSENLSQRIKERVRGNLELIKHNPKIFEADGQKTDNDGTFRKFTAIYVRVVYKIDGDRIIIARVRYSLAEPTEY